MKKPVVLLLVLTLVPSLLAGCQEAEPAPASIPETASFDTAPVSSVQEQASEAPTQGVTEAAETDLPVTEPTESTVRQTEPCDQETEATTPPETEPAPPETTPAPTEKPTEPPALNCTHEGMTVVETPATCERKGIKTYTCKKCGYTNKEETPALGHKWVEINRIDATELTAGSVTYVCSACGKGKTETLAKLQHTHELQSETVKEPTCTSNGVKVTRCVKDGVGCGYSKTETITALGHDMQRTQTVAATYDEGGYEIWTCTRCGATERRNETPKLEKPKQWDIQAAMNAGNAKIQELGMKLDTSLTVEGSSFFPFERAVLSWVKSQEDLNKMAADEVVSCYKSLAHGHTEEDLKYFRARCYIRIGQMAVNVDSNGNWIYEPCYEIFCLYG